MSSTEVYAQGITRLKPRCLIWKISLKPHGKNCFWAHSAPGGCKTDVPIFLLEACQHLLSARRGHSHSFSGGCLHLHTSNILNLSLTWNPIAFLFYHQPENIHSVHQLAYTLFIEASPLIMSVNVRAMLDAIKYCNENENQFIFLNYKISF